jgi:hypothetical protein
LGLFRDRVTKFFPKLLVTGLDWGLTGRKKSTHDGPDNQAARNLQGHDSQGRTQATFVALLPPMR